MKTFSEVATLWQQGKQQYVKVSTMSVYRHQLSKHLLPHFGHMKRIGQNDVQRFAVQLLHAGYKTSCIRGLLVLLRMIVHDGSRRGIFPYCDWKIVFPTYCQQAEKTQVMSIEHQRRLTIYLCQHITNKNLGILISLSTGMRIGELCALQWKDIDMVSNTIHVNKTLERIYDSEQRQTRIIINTPKTSSSQREIPMTKDLRAILAMFCRFSCAEHYVLTNQSKPTEPRTYRRYFQKLLHQLGLPTLKFHGLRHSFATRCIESKCDYKTVSAILGHASLATTMDIYVHPDLMQKRRCINKMYRGLRT